MQQLLVLAGDGVGCEVINEAIKVLEVLRLKDVSITEAPIGMSAFHKLGSTLPTYTINRLNQADIVLLGAVGKNNLYDLDCVNPEKALLKLRQKLHCFVNLRPIVSYKSVQPLQYSSCCAITILRELTSGAYFGKPRGICNYNVGQTKMLVDSFSTSKYTHSEVTSIARIAFELALKRNRRVTLVGKSNVLETSKLWQAVFYNISKQYSQVYVESGYIDSTPISILRNPSAYDVVLTDNLFGDVVSDYLSVLSGSLGLLPSASLGFNHVALYEPVHGSAPNIAGCNVANPIGAILSVAMMLRTSCNNTVLAEAVELAVAQVLRRGYRTSDLMHNRGTISTTTMGAHIARFLASWLHENN